MTQKQRCQYNSITACVMAPGLLMTCRFRLKGFAAAGWKTFTFVLIKKAYIAVAAKDTNDPESFTIFRFTQKSVGTILCYGDFLCRKQVTYYLAFTRRTD